MKKISPICNYRTLSIVTGLILVLVVIHFITKPRMLFNVSHLEYRNSCYDNLEEIIRVRSSNNQIVVTNINYAYIDLTMHWIHRLIRMNINNFFVYVLDQQSAEYFQHHHLSHLCYYNSQMITKDKSSYTSWGSSSFKTINNNKLFLANKILHLNYSVLISEIDVVWFQDPQKQLKELSKEYDVISQGLDYAQPNNRRNIGFFYLPFRNSSMKIMEEVENILRKNPSAWDQGVFNEVIDRAVRNKQAKDLILDLKSHAFENFYLDPTIPINQTIITHLVGLDSAAHKTFVIKERAFSEDVFGYLSYPRKYLTYNNPSIDPNLQTELLKKAIYLSVILNRTLILPRFHCNHIKFYNNYYNMGVSPNCTAERFVNIEQLNSHYSIRENSFLHNPLVPKHIHNNRISYNKTCDSDQHKNNMAIILDVGDLNCFTIPIQNISIYTCPPSNLYGTVFGYGPVCK